jgi:hypothetical protein
MPATRSNSTPITRCTVEAMPQNLAWIGRPASRVERWSGHSEPVLAFERKVQSTGQGQDQDR